MSYDSPSNELDDKEVCNYLKATNKMSIIELVKKIWKDGFEWGYELGLEENEVYAKDFFINPKKIELEDGNKKDKEGMFYGGIQYIGETLDNYLGEIEKDFNKLSVSELLELLDEGNIKIKNIDKVIK